MNPNALRVGYIGLGTMGAAMAGRLVVPTNILTVFDLRPAAVDRLVQAGALGARSVAAVANAAEVVLVNVVEPGNVVTPNRARDPGSNSKVCASMRSWPIRDALISPGASSNSAASSAHM